MIYPTILAPSPGLCRDGDAVRKASEMDGDFVVCWSRIDRLSFYSLRLTLHQSDSQRIARYLPNIIIHGWARATCFSHLVQIEVGPRGLSNYRLPDWQRCSLVPRRRS